MADKIGIGILGASGYTGAEALRLLAGHRQAEIRWLTAERNAGQPVAALFPHLGDLSLPRMERMDAVDLAAADAILCCLPHGLTQAALKDLPRGPKVVDLSADFRLRDPDLYAAVYGAPHGAVDLQKEAVYGLTEHYREAVRGARLVANPGCYTTTAELALVPLLKAGLIREDGIIVDAKSGVSGAGRAAKEANLFTEVSEGFHAYAVATHRHAPEIEQCLSDFAARPVRITFTPHLVPMNRGIFATVYVKLKGGVRAEDLQTGLESAYAGEPFVRVLPFKGLPATRHVRGSNACLLAVHPSRIEGEAILLSVTDNLVKGAAGQAIQNMNLMLGLDETGGLDLPPLFP
ncbi:MAG: N-acetyl-gamma-glutamyl-phosphate reductase [Geminicoccaceae bacterium]|nr:N-acetyl-gamma-glutamyl-phosphate reductase [Geminicoccaceae bacterium]